MSLLLPDEFFIVLYPDRCELSHTRREIGWQGVARRVLETRGEAAQPGGATAWSGALAALEAALAGKVGKHARATVFLSNQLVRYVLVPWSDALSSEEEELAAARHCFRNVYGDAADGWELRLSPAQAGAPQLASAVDAALPEALRELFQRLGVAMASLQPQLMAAYNVNRSILHGRSAWFLVQEPGHLCLARLRQGSWASVRTLRVGTDWLAEMPVILEREAYLADAGVLPEQVLLCAPRSGEAVWPAKQHWPLEWLELPEPDGLAPLAG